MEIAIKMKKYYIALCAVMFAVACNAGSTANIVESRLAASAPVELGRWHASLSKCKEYAHAHGVPLIAVWSNGDLCGHCIRFQDALNTSVFKQWMKNSGCVFLFVHSGDRDGRQGGTVFNFTYKTQSTFPFVRVYWYVDGRKAVDVFTEGDVINGGQSGTNGGKNAVLYFKKILKDYEYTPSGAVLSVGNGVLTNATWRSDLVADVTIPSTVKEIGNGVFAGSIQLGGVLVPSSVTNIAASAFADCPNLKNIAFKGDRPEIDATAFAGLPDDCTVSVFSGAQGWEEDFYGVPVTCVQPLTAHFDANGGELDEQYATERYYQGESVAMPKKDPVRNGFRFLGWFDEAEGGEEVYGGEISNDVVFYAHWIKRVTVTFNANGGEYDDTCELDAGSCLDYLPWLYRAGYTFLGWYSAPEDGVRFTDDETVESDMTLYAHWADTGVSWQYEFTGESSIAITGIEGEAGQVTIPYTLGDWNVAGIDAWIFNDLDDSLFDVATVPGVKLLDGWIVGYSDVSGELDLDIPAIRGIANGAFSGCDGLTGVRLPSGIATIGAGTFECCGNLQSVSIPEGVMSIENNALANCGNLEIVDFAGNMHSIDMDENSAFADTPWLEGLRPSNDSMENAIEIDGVSGSVDCPLFGATDYDYADSVVFWDLPESSQPLRTVWYWWTAPADGDYTFTVSCANGRAYVGGINDLVDFDERIGENAPSSQLLFYADGGMCYCIAVAVQGRCEDVVLSWSADPFSFDIEDGVIVGCHGVCPALVSIPEDVVDIDPWVMQMFGRAEAFAVEGNNRAFSVESGILFDASKTKLLRYPPARRSARYDVPEGVCEIGAYAFAGCAVREVSVPRGVESIGEEAFCSGSLDTIVFYGDEPEVAVFENDETGDITTPFYEGSRLFIRRDAGWSVTGPAWWNNAWLTYSPALSAGGGTFTRTADGTYSIAALDGATLSPETIRITATLDDGSEIDCTAGYDIAVSPDGKSATVRISAPGIGAPSDGESSEVVSDESDPSGFLVTGDVEVCGMPEHWDELDWELIGILPVKTTKGLYYRAEWGASLDSLGRGEKVQATGNCLYLGVIKQTGPSGFYKVTVSDH